MNAPPTLWTPGPPWLARLLAISLLIPITVLAGSITTPGIVNTTVAGIPACMQWAIIEICVWLNCTLTGCSVETSIMVGNYNPDLVVTAYHRTGDSPWVEMAAAFGGMQKAMGQAIINEFMAVVIGEGDRPNGKFHRAHQDLIFKEADAIGHPMLSLLGHLPEGYQPTGAIEAGS